MAGAVVRDKVVESLEYVGNRELAERFKHGREGLSNHFSLTAKWRQLG